MQSLLLPVPLQNSTRYFQLPSPESLQRHGNEYVNHAAPTAMTPMTPASDCPLLGDRGISPPTPLPQVPSPYEKPYSALGELRPIHLVSFAHQVASGMVSEHLHTHSFIAGCT